jgi:hypothetical protein
MLLLAAQLPFRRVEGVEFDGELQRTALRNLEQHKGEKRRCEHIHVHHVDAAQYEIPEGPCVFYLYNPFGHSVLKQVFDNVEAAYRMHPRDMVFVYANPKGRHLFEERTFLRESRIASWTRFVNWLSFPWSVAIYRTRDA